LTFGPEARSQEASVREARAFLQEVLQALTGRQVSLVTRLEGRQPPAVSEPEPDRREKLLRAEVERHPAVKNLQQLFGAELFDINPPE
jgi:DNA polymerase-3 subunit gamma/tau